MRLERGAEGDDSMWQSMAPRARSRGFNVRSTRMSPCLAFARRVAGLLVLALCFAMPSTAWAAAYATGGSSPYRNTVLWLT